MSTPALLVVTCLASSAHGFQAHRQGADGPWWPSTSVVLVMTGDVESGAACHHFITGEALARDAATVCETCGEGLALEVRRIPAFTGVLGAAAEVGDCSVPQAGPLALVLLAITLGLARRHGSLGHGHRIEQLPPGR